MVNPTPITNGDGGGVPAAVAQKSRADMTEEEKAAFKAEKKAKKQAEAEAKKAKKKAAAEARAASEAEAALLNSIEYLSVNDAPAQMYGAYKVIQSACEYSGSGRKFADISSWVGVEAPCDGDSGTHWVRGRMQKLLAPSADFGFVTVRSNRETVQAVITGKEMLKWAKKNLTAESVIDIEGCLVSPDEVVTKCSVSKVELQVARLYIVSRAESPLPLNLEDAGQQLDKDGNPVHTEAGRPKVTRDTRLNNRVIDVRVPSHSAILRVQSGVCYLFREFLHMNDFVEIHSPKILGGASEGGAEVFRMKYFGKDACLAQSPQLYKQSAICGDLKRVFEIGPVFRAEKSNTHRHMTEFTGLDLEMEITEHYSELLDVLDGLFTHIFEGLEKKYEREVELVRGKWNVPIFEHLGKGKQLVLKWPDAIAMLRESGVEMDDLGDLSTENERTLGKLVKEKFSTDFFFLTHYPNAVRPFYTMPDPADERYSNSFDIMMRGEEIVSGAQRVHDVEMLRNMASKKLGLEEAKTLESYFEGFKYGTPPHGGCGVGLERVVMLYLGIGNIRECSFFPRDPNRLAP